jgi:uncharacterized membrane protein YdjX (TVP38/TMEM64 family)
MRSRWRIFGLAIGAAAVIAIGAIVWSGYDHQAVMDWLHGLRPLPFFAAMALLPAIGFPTTPFSILAGASFGVPIGLVGSWIAIVVNATLCFWIARLLRPLFVRLLRTLKTEPPRYTEKDKRSMRLLLGVKLTPGPPAFVKNYALGISGVSFKRYLVVSMIFAAVYATVFVVIGESLLRHALSPTIIALAVLAALVWLGIRRHRRNRLTPQPT